MPAAIKCDETFGNTTVEKYKVQIMQKSLIDFFLLFFFYVIKKKKKIAMSCGITKKLRKNFFIRSLSDNVEQFLID
jgi:hypothetical protein